jgi:hypothetical protein
MPDTEPYQENPPNAHQIAVKEQFTTRGWKWHFDQYLWTVTVSPAGDEMTHRNAPTTMTLYDKLARHRDGPTPHPKGRINDNYSTCQQCGQLMNTRDAVTVDGEVRHREHQE